MKKSCSPDGAFLIDKHPGVSSFGIIEALKHLSPEHKFWKLGHGGTLDPFATGLLIVCVGRGVKLSRYFLGSAKTYEATLKFGETTVPGDPTAEITDRSDILPSHLEYLNEQAALFKDQEYHQIPPMHSAKKVNGKPLYELARQGIDIERDSKHCKLTHFHFSSYESPLAHFSVQCSSGTYVRALAQDFSIKLGTVGMLTELRRTGSGSFTIQRAQTVQGIKEALASGTQAHELPCFVPFDKLLCDYPKAAATHDEAVCISQGKQGALLSVLNRTDASIKTDILALYDQERLFAVARKDQDIWGIERVFPEAQS